MPFLSTFQISPFAGGLHHCVVNIPAPIYLLLFRSLLILEQVWVRHGPGMAQTRSRVISNLDEAIVSVECRFKIGTPVLCFTDDYLNPMLPHWHCRVQVAHVKS